MEMKSFPQVAIRDSHCNHRLEYTPLNGSDEEMQVNQVIDDESENQESSLSMCGKGCCRLLLGFSGPGALVSMIYLDPGSIAVDIHAGAEENYKLLWILTWSTLIGFTFQRLAARLGTVTGDSLAFHCHNFYKRLPRIGLWILMQIAVVMSNIQQVFGTAITIYILSQCRVPIWGGVLITFVDTLSVIVLESFEGGIQSLEAFFYILIACLTGVFSYLFRLAKPDGNAMLSDLIVPTTGDLGTFKTIMDLAGACFVPHNLYLHSSLTTIRELDRRHDEAVKKANCYYSIETFIALAFSLVVNVLILSTSASQFYQNSNIDVNKSCQAHNITTMTECPMSNQTTEANVVNGGFYFLCHYGYIPFICYGLAIFMAGQGSAITGTYSGQLIMEGFLRLKWSLWMRIVVTRSLALLPALVFYDDNINSLGQLLHFLNGFMLVFLPFALIPLYTFTNSRKLMNGFANGIASKIWMGLVIIAVLAFSVWFLIRTIIENIHNKVARIMIILLGFYLYLNLYLICCMIEDMGHRWVKKPLHYLFWHTDDYSNKPIYRVTSKGSIHAD